jgi:hypothetical protein
MGRLQSRYRHAINEWEMYYRQIGHSKREARVRTKKLFGGYRRWLQGLTRMRRFFKKGDEF